MESIKEVSLSYVEKNIRIGNLTYKVCGLTESDITDGIEEIRRENIKQKRIASIKTYIEENKISLTSEKGRYLVSLAKQ